MAEKIRSRARLIGLAIVAGVAFNVSQRVLDFLLDDAFKHVSFLAWLAD